MKGKKLLSYIGEIDNKFIEEVSLQTETRHERKSIFRSRWLAPVAACIAVMLISTVVFNNLKTNNNNQQMNGGSTMTHEIGVDAAALRFVMDGKIYSEITFDKSKEYDLIPQDAIGLLPRDAQPKMSDGDVPGLLVPKPSIAESDIGEFMGITESEDKVVDGKSAYHYSSYPTDASICVVEVNGEYELFTLVDLVTQNLADRNSTTFLNAYAITQENIVSISILSDNNTLLTTINDKTEIGKIIGILSDKEDIGLVAYSQLLADLWFANYGNRDVYSDGNGSMHYINDDVDTKAHVLWNENLRQIQVKNQDGYEFSIIYTPAIKLFCMGDSYYMLTDSDDALFRNNFLVK